jgi:hypothetical protein
MGSAEADDPGLDLRRDLVWTPAGPRAPVGERAQALGGVADQPPVYGAAIDAVAGGNVGDPGTVEHLSHREVALLDHRKLREHLQILLGSGEPK